jgi:uncharacterized RDD family membrane protein YckC
MDQNELEYAGFWRRVWASLIDTVLLLVITFPVLAGIYGDAYWNSSRFIQGPADFLISWVWPAVAVIAFWAAGGATPGKMAIAARVVDAATGGKPSFGQLVIRYIGYFLASLPLGLGLLWVAWDSKKQGWHDKLAKTVVVRRKTGLTEPVQFNGNGSRTEPDS